MNVLPVLPASAYRKGIAKRKLLVFLSCIPVLILALSFVIYNLSGRRLNGEEHRVELLSEKFAPQKSDGKKPAVLLLHGYGGSPYDFKPLIDAFDKQGIAYHAVLLPGHGSSPKDLNKVSSDELVNAALDAYDDLHEEYGEVIVAGFSMGGGLSLNVAGERDPVGLVLFGAYVEVTRKWYYFGRAEDWARRLHKIMPYVRKIGDMNINDPEGKKLYDSYHTLPVKTVMELEKIGKEAKEKADDIHCPVLWLHSREDIAADYNAAKKCFDKIASDDKEFITYEKSNHIILFDYDAEDAVKRTLEFMKRSSLK